MDKKKPKKNIYTHEIDLTPLTIKSPCKEDPEVLMKAYKWIWGQEDCNYPPPLQGRDMSMKAILELKGRLKKG